MNNKYYTGQRVRNAREELNISQEELGKRYGSTAANISQIERGVRTVGIESLRRLASILGKPLEWFIVEDNKPYSRPPKAALSDLQVSLGAYMPVYGDVSAGPGIEPIDYVATSRTRLAPERLVALRVKGLCLEPEIKDGDTLIIDKELQPQNGDLVVVLIDGLASVKKYRQKMPDQVSEKGKPEVWLENNGGKYKPENVRQIGVVIEFIRKRR
jgi:SOS-response transcriptional repressor LexA